MKIPFKLTTLIAATLACLSPLQAQVVDGPPALIDYQGRVLNSLGDPIAPVNPENIEMYFRIWDAQSGGALQWAEKQIVTVFNGDFSVRLGEGDPITVADGENVHLTGQDDPHGSLLAAFDGDERFLGLSVSANSGTNPAAEIEPRLAFLASPYAMVAGKVADAAIGNDELEDLAVTSAKIATNTITAANIASSAVDTDELSNGAVTADKLGGDIGLWSVTSGNVYRNSGKVAIGTTPSAAELHIKNGSDPTIKIQSDGDNELSGRLSLRQNNDTGADIFYDGTSGVDALQIQMYTGGGTLNSTPLTVEVGGQVGIGTVDPRAPLHVDGGTNAQLSGGGYFMVGTADGTNLLLDNNDFMARNGNQTSLLRINREGGDIQLGSSASNIHMPGDVGIGTIDPNTALELRKSAPSLRVAADAGNLASLQLFEIAGGNPFGFEFQYDGATDKLHLLSHGFSGNEGNRVTFTKNGNVGIGTTAPGAALHVKQKGNGEGIRIEESDNLSYWDIYHGESSNDLIFEWTKEDGVQGTVARLGNASGAFTITSDRRSKKDFEPLESALTQIEYLPVMRYRYKHISDAEAPKSYGFIAQDVEKVFPDLVSTSEGTKSLAITHFIPINTRAIQELKAEKDSELAARDKKIADLEARLARLEAMMARTVSLEGPLTDSVN